MLRYLTNIKLHLAWFLKRENDCLEQGRYDHFFRKGIYQFRVVEFWDVYKNLRLWCIVPCPSSRHHSFCSVELPRRRRNVNILSLFMQWDYFFEFLNDRLACGL
jgi:hypothetical protein